MAVFCAVGLPLGAVCEGNKAEKYFLRREILHPPEGNVLNIKMLRKDAYFQRLMKNDRCRIIFLMNACRFSFFRFFALFRLPES